MMLGWDCETTGKDLRHGALPFLITHCDENDDQRFWQADVDPITRIPQWSEQDLKEIKEDRDAHDVWLLQNGKFDFLASEQIGLTLPDPLPTYYDTLIASHLINSSQPHDLTTLVLIHLGINIKPYEDAVKEACNKARAIARKKYPKWRIAKEGDPMMPSAKSAGKKKDNKDPNKDYLAKYDMWLPRQIAIAEKYPDDHPWWTVTADYANIDSSCMVHLFKAQMEVMKEKGLWEIFLERMKVVPVIHTMEGRGITMSKKSLDKKRKDYRKESEDLGNVCVQIAKDMDYDLVLPKSSNNNSLLHFCFGKPIKDEEGTVKEIQQYLNLPIVERTEAGNPSLDKHAVEAYELSADVNETQLKFIQSLSGKRKRDTALTYMDSYERYWKPWLNYDDWYAIYSSINPTGTDTLRMASSNPNQQNISDKKGFNLREIFGPAPGREWWSLDYENIELRIPAYESGEELMIEIFEKPNDPPYFGSYHLMNASIIFPDEFWPLSEDKDAFKTQFEPLYKRTKNFGFAVSYGAMLASGTADKAAGKKGAQRLVMDRLKEHTKLNDSMVAHANKYGYVETIPDRTVNPHRGYPVYCKRSLYGKIRPTVPLNYHVQSTAMWCMMKAMIRVQECISNWPDHFIILQVHDELVFDFPKGGARNLPKIKKIKRLMEQSGDDIGIPLKVSVKYHPENWSKDCSI